VQIDDIQVVHMSGQYIVWLGGARIQAMGMESSSSFPMLNPVFRIKK
jgi:hypothetical protein